MPIAPRAGCFDGLPLGLRLLRMERGLRAERLDRRLELLAGTYHRWEHAELDPTTRELARVLDMMEVSLPWLHHVLSATRWIDWPPSGAEAFPARTRSDFARARAVMEAFASGRRRMELGDHGFDTFAAALRWLREFFDLSQDELAERIDRSSDTVVILELGKRLPSRATTSQVSWSLEPPFNLSLAHAGHLGVRPFLWPAPVVDRRSGLRRAITSARRVRSDREGRP